MSTDPAQQDSDWLLFQKCSAMPEVNFCNLCSPTGRDFITRLLQIDPQRRMSVADALNHPWLSDATVEPVLAPPNLLVGLMAHSDHEEQYVCKAPCQSVLAPSDAGVVDKLWAGEVRATIWGLVDAPVLAPPDVLVDLMAQSDHEEQYVCKEPCQSVLAPSDNGVTDKLCVGEVGATIWGLMDAPVLAPPDAPVELMVQSDPEEQYVCKEPCQSVTEPSDTAVIEMLWTGEVGAAVWDLIERQRVVGNGILAEWVQSAWTVKGEGSSWLW